VGVRRMELLLLLMWRIWERSILVSMLMLLVIVIVIAIVSESQSGLGFG
jgi:hypothetical protein